MRWTLLLLLVGGCDCRSQPGPDPGAAASTTLAEGQRLASAVAADAGPPCLRAYREIARLRQMVDAGTPGTLPEASFVARCEALPAEVQDCLRPSRAAVEADRCARLVDGLPEAERAAARALARLH